MKELKLIALCTFGFIAATLSSVLCNASDINTMNTYKKEDLDDSLYDGQWQLFDQYFELYLPTDWDYSVPDTNDSVSKCLFLFEKGDEPKLTLSIEKMDAADTFEYGIGSLDKLSEDVEHKNYTDISAIQCNTFSCLRYTDPENDRLTIAFFDLNGNEYSLNFTPASDSSLTPVIDQILRSLSAAGTNPDAIEILVSDEVTEEAVAFLAD